MSEMRRRARLYLGSFGDGEASQPVPEPKFVPFLAVGVLWGAAMGVIMPVLQDEWSLARFGFWTVVGGLLFALVAFWVQRRRGRRWSPDSSIG
jgi:membrane associated rhomboid family serine protease